MKYDSWHKEVLSKFGQMLGSNMTEFHSQISKVRRRDPGRVASLPANPRLRVEFLCSLHTVTAGVGAALGGHGQHLGRGDLHHLRAVFETKDKTV